MDDTLGHRILSALIVKPGEGGQTLSREECAELLADLGPLESAEMKDALARLEKEGAIAVALERPAAWLSVLRPDEVGPVRLLRQFVNKHCGDVSPRISEKMVRSVLKRHGARHELGTPAVDAALMRLETLGVVRVLKVPDAYVKMLGREG